MASGLPHINKIKVKEAWNNIIFPIELTYTLNLSHTI